MTNPPEELWSDFRIDQMLDPQEFAALSGLVFRGVTITPSRNGGWNVICRAWRGPDPVYAMTDAKYPPDGLRMLAWAIGRKGGDEFWHHDRFAK